MYMNAIFLCGKFLYLQAPEIHMWACGDVTQRKIQLGFFKTRHTTTRCFPQKEDQPNILTSAAGVIVKLHLHNPNMSKKCTQVEDKLICLLYQFLFW